MVSFIFLSLETIQNLPEVSSKNGGSSCIVAQTHARTRRVGKNSPRALYDLGYLNDKFRSR